MNLQKTIAKYLADNITGIHLFKDDVAWNAAGNPYPYLLITEISSSKQNLGTGTWDRDFPKDDGDSFLLVKAIKDHVVLRFTVRAVNRQSQNGNDIVTAICTNIEDLFFDLCRTGSIDLPIPGSISEEHLHVEKVVFRGRADLSPDEGGEPFVYQKSLSYLFVTHRHYEQEISKTIDEIVITAGSNNG